MLLPEGSGSPNQGWEMFGPFVLIFAGLFAVPLVVAIISAVTRNADLFLGTLVSLPLFFVYRELYRYLWP